MKELIVDLDVSYEDYKVLSLEEIKEMILERFKEVYSYEPEDFLVSSREVIGEVNIIGVTKISSDSHYDKLIATSIKNRFPDIRQRMEVTLDDLCVRLTKMKKMQDAPDGGGGTLGDPYSYGRIKMLDEIITEFRRLL